MFHAKAIAATKAYKASKQSSRSIIDCLSEQASNYSVDLEALIVEFEALYPNILHPIITAKQKKKSKTKS